MKVYQKIAKYMNDNGIKQKYVAENIGMAENLFSMVLNGKRNLTADEFVEIILLFGVDANYFINNDDN